MGNFEVCYSFVGFVYVYCLIHQSVVVFCLVFLRKSTVQFFSNVHVSFVFRGRSAVHFLFFSFFLYLSILVMFMSVLCSVMISFLYLVFFMSVLCSVIKLLFSFFVFVNFRNAHVCLVFRHVQLFVFANFINGIQVLFNFINIMYLNLRVYLIVFVFIDCVFILWYSVLQFFCKFQF